MISAGEASGDAHAADVLALWRERHGRDGAPSSVFGMGGARLAEAGCELIVDNRDLSVIGFVDVLLNYHRFLARLARLRAALRERRPALLLIVDYPDFNLKLADTARALGIPVLMYVAPQVWAWRAGRIPGIVRRIDRLAVLFPFEERLWREAGATVDCVGHPMVQSIDLTLSAAEAAARVDAGLDLDPSADRAGAHELVALLPGSRPGELARLMPLLMESAARIAARRPHTRFVLPRAASLTPDTIERALADARAALPDGLEAPDIAVLDPAREPATVLLAAATLALVASGTATLETGLVGTPMLVVYRVASLNAWLMKRLIRVPDLALVNIVAERRVVPEFIQEDARADAIAAAAVDLLDAPDRLIEMREALQVIRERLGGTDASARVADIMDDMLDA